MIGQPMQTKAFSVYIIYANADEVDNDTDERLCRELKKHLGQLQIPGMIAALYDSGMTPLGREKQSWRRSIIDSADIILFLVSPDFLACPFCKSQVSAAMQKQAAGQAHVIPIHIRPSLWQSAPFAALQSLPRGGGTIDLSQQDQAFTDIAREIDHSMRSYLSTLPERDQRFVEQALQEGERFFRTGDYEQALQHYKGILQVKPTLAIVHSMKGRILYELGRNEQAVAACNKAIQLGSQLVDTYIYKGLSCYRVGLYDEAINALDEAMKLDPNLALAYSHKAHILCRLKRYKEALDLCQQALTHNPTLAGAYDDLAWVHYELGHMQEALACCEQALVCSHLNPDLATLATAYYNKGRILTQLQRDREALAAYEQARQYYEQLIEQRQAMHLWRSLATIYLNKAITHFNLDTYHDALASYTQALDYYQQALQAYTQARSSNRRIVQFYEQVKLVIKQEIAEAFNGQGEMYLHIQPQDARAALRIFEQALDLYAECLSSTPPSEEQNVRHNLTVTWTNKGRAHYELGQYKKALQATDEALRYDRRYDPAHNLRRTILDRRGRS